MVEQCPYKVRAWCFHKKRMFYAPSEDGNRLILYSMQGIKEPFWRLGKFEDGNWPIANEVIYSQSGILMKYTGLNTEKKNESIYEGDIVKGYETGYAEIGLRIKGWDYSCIGVVIQKFGNTYYSLDGVNPHQLLMYLNKIEILGNKYENPELLLELR